MREGVGEGELDWILPVVRSLEKDGLAVTDVLRPSYKNAQAVAEERPAYGAEARSGKSDGEARVRLP